MENVAKDTNYRLKPTLLNALIICVLYIVVLIVAKHTISSVPYTDIAKSSVNMLYGVLIPVFISSIFVTIIAIWSGWWKDVWRDMYKIKGHSWMHIFLILSVISIITVILTVV